MGWGQPMYKITQIDTTITGDKIRTVSVLGPCPINNLGFNGRCRCINGMMTDRETGNATKVPCMLRPCLAMAKGKNRKMAEQIVSKNLLEKLNVEINDIIIN